MCGSGTLLIEAALIARNIAPGVFRKSFAFEKWPDFDQDLFNNIYNDDSAEKEFNHHIYGYDIDPKAVNIALKNIKAAGLSKIISVKQQDFRKFTKPENKSIIVTNPPYGERITTPNLLGTYRMIGEKLKHQFQDNDAWILSYREECFREIGLKPSIKIPLYNGSLECEFRRYQMFDGKFNNFRAEGGSVKTEKEKKEMSKKHRFKKEREFKQRLQFTKENDESDILSFNFHSLNRKIDKERKQKRNYNTKKERQFEYEDKNINKKNNLHKKPKYYDKEN